MKLRLILGSLVVASTAYAQAPGETELAPPGMAPELAPAPPPPPPVRRWSIGLGIGSLDLAPHAAPDSSSEFSVAQLAVRYRMTRRLELELALGGGGEQLSDGYEGEREVTQAVLGMRFRFAPERPWNWWVMAGMGTLSVASVYATDEERDGAQQSTLQFGVGLEKRWTRFALQLELRAVGVAPQDDDEVMPDVRPPGPNMEPSPYGSAPQLGDGGGMAGGQIAISGNYYF